MPAPVGATASFVGGYLLLWAAVGLVAYAILSSGASSTGGSSPGTTPAVGAAGVLPAAAVYEFTPLKEACLKRCRGPLGFLVSEWREAARRGAHGGRARRVVRGVLLGVDGGVVRARRDEPALDDRHRPAHRRREDCCPGAPPPPPASPPSSAVLAVGVAVAPGSVPGLTDPLGPAPDGDAGDRRRSLPLRPARDGHEGDEPRPPRQWRGDGRTGHGCRPLALTPGRSNSLGRYAATTSSRATARPSVPAGGSVAAKAVDRRTGCVWVRCRGP